MAAVQADAGRTTAPVPPIYAGPYRATYLTLLAWRGDGETFDRVLTGLHRPLRCPAHARDDGRDPRRGARAGLLGRFGPAAALYPEVVAILDEGLVLRRPGLAAELAVDEAAAASHFDDADGC